MSLQRKVKQQINEEKKILCKSYIYSQPTSPLMPQPSAINIDNFLILD